MIEALGEALSLLLVPSTLLLLAIALLVGMATSILPGIGTVATLALLMSFTFGMDPHLGIGFLVVLLGAGGFSGSLTAILINVPGETQNAATLLDGYPMSQQGRAGEAIGASATASALGALFGVGVLILSIPVLREVILAFGPPEMFAMTLAGVALISVISRGNAAKGVTSGLLGMALGFVGVEHALGGHRFTYGFQDIYDGLPLIPLIIGLFAVPELYELLRQNRSISQTGTLAKGGIGRGVLSVLRHPIQLVRSSLIGTGVGIVPGVGSSVAPWVAYFVAKGRSRDPDSFGHGNVEGVIAPEASNDAKDGGGFMPLLAFGVPGSLSMAILLGAFQFHGVQTGQRMFEQNMELIWFMILALLFANFGSSLVGLAFSNILVKITIVPAIVLSPIVLSVGLIGSFADHRRMFSIFLAVAIGFVAVGMVRAGYPRPPLLVGFVLVPMTERFFHLSLRLERGEYTFLFRPITLAILLVIVLALLYPVGKVGVQWLWRRYQSRPEPEEYRGRVEAGVREGETAVAEVERGDDGEPPDGASGGPPAEPSEETDAGSQQPDPVYSPLSGLLISALFLGLAVLFLASMGDFDDDGRLFPRIVLLPMALLTGAILVIEAQRVVSALRSGASIRSASARFPDWWVTAWVVVLPVLITLIGMVPACGVFVTLVRLFFDRGRITVGRVVMALVLGVGTAVGIRTVFETLLGVRLLEGVII